MAQIYIQQKNWENKRMNIAFRVDASVTIGTGHVMRCLTLAEELKELGFNCFFLCRNHDGNLIDFIEDKGFIVFKLETTLTVSLILEDYSTWIGTTAEQDAHQSIEFLKSRNFDWLVIDHYGIDVQWEKLVRPYVQKVFVIDDLANRRHDCDILLDQNLVPEYETRYECLVPSHCKLLLGPKYALLRKEFREIRQKFIVREQNRILLFFGGTDPVNATERVINASAETTFINKWHVDVVVGNNNINKMKIKEICEKYDNVNYYCQVKNMAELMMKATFGIMAGGSTTWERYCVGLPAILITIAENQILLNEYLSQKGIDVYIGNYNEISPESIQKGITGLLRKVKNARKQCKQIVDGEGVRRVVSHILGQLREIQESDLPLLLEWRNQPFVRQNMFNNSIITMDHHRKWYEKMKVMFLQEFLNLMAEQLDI
jgi:UDP-2,4-diacetamido-2,4,6-trideoxy-beta-L-altropyranose hydrolase